MKMTAEEYARRVKQVGPRSPLGSDCLWAFCVGGGICLLGEVLRGWSAAFSGILETDCSRTFLIVFIGFLLP